MELGINSSLLPKSDIRNLLFRLSSTKEEGVYHLKCEKNPWQHLATLIKQHYEQLRIRYKTCLEVVFNAHLRVFIPTIIGLIHSWWHHKKDFESSQGLFFTLYNIGPG